VLLEGEGWRTFFDGYTESAWRLELLPSYAMPQEAERLARFLAGERLPEDYHSSWMDRVSQYVASGRVIGRVHVVRRPLSDYLLFEFDHYRHHARAGEDIRILDVTDNYLTGLPDHDFWLFDDVRVVKMLYREDGTQIGRELVENVDLDKYRQLKETALANAVPFAEYWQP
jgi:uncharacterized protein DUF6879